MTDYIICDLIALSLPLFLLHQHDFTKSNVLKSGQRRAVDKPAQSPRMLQPIIDLLQYQVFLKRVRGELTRAVEKLREVKVPVDLRFEGSSNSVNVEGLLESKDAIGGEALLRLNER